MGMEEEKAKAMSVLKFLMVKVKAPTLLDKILIIYKSACLALLVGSGR